MIVVIIFEPPRDNLTGLTIHPLLRRRELDGSGMPWRALPHRRLVEHIGPCPSWGGYLPALPINSWHRKRRDNLRPRRHALPKGILAIPLARWIAELRNCREQNISISRRARPRPKR